LDLFGADDVEHLGFSNFSSNAFTSNTEGLHNEPSTMAVVQGQGRTFLNQDSCGGELFLDDTMQGGPDFSSNEDGYSAPDYVGASSLSPSSLPSGVFFDIDSYFSPSLLEEPAEPSPSWDPFNATGQHMMDVYTKLREILPRPMEPMSTHAEPNDPPARRSKDEKPKKNRPCDLARQNKKITKPVRCHLCSDNFAFRKELKKHYVVSHKEYAASIGLRVERFPCQIPGCKKSYTRSDNLTRHRNDKHGRVRR